MFRRFWTQPEFIVLKPLLIRWGTVYLLSAFIVAGWLIQITFKPHQQTFASEKPGIKISTRFEQVFPKKTTSSKPKAKQPVLKKEVEAKPVLAPRSETVPGNTYAAGNCTWYAKSKRPDLPNNLGNANTWASRAKAQGYETGNEPREGAIGQRGMHVVYVERVNPDNTVLISEMNYVGLGKINNRTLPANSFTYIY